MAEHTERVECYVCGGKGGRDKMLYLTGGLWRHKSKCAPGSTAWMNSEVGRKSKHRAYFKERVTVNGSND